MTGNEVLDRRDIAVQLKVYELRMMMEALKSVPWKHSHPVLLSCDAQLQQFEQREKDMAQRRTRDIQKQKNVAIESLAKKKADEMYNIKVAALEEKEKKKRSRRRKKSRR